jgi:AGCS family alanine or glycine:cation symporter
VIISTLTGLVIVTTLHYEPGLTAGIGGIEMTSFAFERNLAWSAFPLALAALLFAFSTALAWSYYGLKGWTYLFGEGKWGAGAFKLVFCVFTVLGAITPLQPLIAFSDALVFLISVPNVIGLYWLAPLVKRELRIYRVMLRSGEVVDYREERKLAEPPRPRK